MRRHATRLALPIVLLLISASPALAAFATLTGSVTDQNGAGIAGVQISFVDACTGVTAASSGNITSSTGSFRATVIAGIYDLEFAPPAGSLFVAHRILNFDLTANRTLAPLALPYGVMVSGRVFDAAGAGIPGVYARFFRPGDSDRTFAVRDRTDATGLYSIVIPPGTYDVRYGPPAGTRDLGLVRPGVAIPGNTVLPDVTLGTGLLIGGTVVDSSGSGGKPVINVNIDPVDAVTGERLFVSHDRTDAAGSFSIAVPPGSYDLLYKPEQCTLLVAQASATVTVTAADLAMPPVMLASGVLVRGTVTDVRGTLLFDVNTNYRDGAGVQVLTFGDHTDAAGAYSAVVPPDSYTIDYIPPAGARLAGVRTTGIDIRNATTLPVVQLPDAVFISGRVVSADGRPLDRIDLDIFDPVTALKLFTPYDSSGPDGRFAVPVVPGTYDVRFDPPVAAGLAAKRLPGIQVASDRSLGDVVLVRGYPVSGLVTTTTGLAVSGADLDFFETYSHRKVETLNDNTDTAGLYSVIVPAGLYDVRVEPAPGDPLESGQRLDVPITGPLAALDFALRDAVMLTGFVASSLSGGVGGVDLDLFRSDTGLYQETSRDNSGADGTFSVFVPPATYDIHFTPPVATGLALRILSGILVSADTDIGEVLLDAAISPAVTSITPASGPSHGGTAVTILGSGFQAGATCTLGGYDLINPLITPGRIDALTPAIPLDAGEALVDLTVANHGGAAAATLPAAFTYAAGASPLNVSITRASPSIVLNWGATGQAFYTVYRSATAGAFGPAQVLTIMTGTTFVDIGADEDGMTYFYRVE